MHTLHASRFPAATAAFLLTVLAAASAHADDTEIFVNQTQSAGAQPNILLIFDTSGSMDTNVDLPKAPYDPDRNYGGSCARDVLYWRRGPGSPPACNSAQRIPLTANTCSASSVGLVGLPDDGDSNEEEEDPAGLFSARLAQWDSAQRRWSPLNPQLGSAPVECRNDAGKHGDRTAAQWAANADAGPWSGDAASEISWTGVHTYTLYTGNWLNWFYAPSDNARISRLATAAAAAKTLAYSIDGVNLGVMRFDSDANGGMVVSPVGDIATNREALVDTIRLFEADGQTPLSETLYEAGQYFAGGEVEFGNEALGNNGTSSPSVPASRSPQAADSRLYGSPIRFQCQRNFVILLTDGEPSNDDEADVLMTDLPGWTTVNPNGCAGSGDGRCLDEMARYMRNRDLVADSTLTGLQTVTTYTVGFGPEVAGSATLERVADAGGGQAFAANNILDLTSALQEIVTDIGQRSATFTTASVAVNAFNRTQSTNEVFISVFQPSETEHWPGNLKKYALVNGQIVDQTGAVAVDAVTGFFSDRARSFWSPPPRDGQEVEVGGAASQLPSPSQRKLYTHLENATQPSTDLTAGVNAVHSDNTALSDTVLGTSTTEPTRAQLIDWIRGIDVRDADGDGNRSEHNRFMGDPLHARPELVTYGQAADESIIYMPTNDGVLHALRADTGAELWSFVPQELLPRLKDLYRDGGIVTRSYGLDGEVRVLRFDVNGNGIIEPLLEDRVIVYFGMRRGGRSYYALDVTDRHRPKMFWRIGASATGAKFMPGIGETWSPPAIARVVVGDGAGQNSQRLVLVFGGGYDPTQEDTVFKTDTSGNRIYMVDAVTGALLWFAGGPNSAGTPNLQLAKMTHSIPSRINVLDTDGDGLSDRMYVGDMGGRVWRFDIWNRNEVATLVTGGVFADLGAASEQTPTIENTRRFYNAPDVALIQRRGANAYYNIAIGSGYRGHPLHTATRDRFYSLRDTLPFKRMTQQDYEGFAAITDGPLTDIATNISSTNLPLDARGFKLELRLNGAGEKVLAEAVTVNGVLLFTTYQPQASSADPCAPSAGLNRAYALSVDRGRPVIDFNDNLRIDDTDAWTRLSQTGIAGEITYLLETPTHAQGQGPAGSPIETGPRDVLGRRGVCMVGVEVLRKCVPPGNVVRTFWQRRTVN
jgi:type IV pilus assembly protein PilY1